MGWGEIEKSIKHTYIVVSADMTVKEFEYHGILICSLK